MCVHTYVHTCIHTYLSLSDLAGGREGPAPVSPQLPHAWASGQHRVHSTAIVRYATAACACACTYVCMCVYMYMHVHTHVHVHVHVRILK